MPENFLNVPLRKMSQASGFVVLPLNEFNGCYEKPAKSRLKASPEPVLTGFR
jgi:hypothetical protein